MAITIEKLVGVVKWDTNSKELVKARGDVDKLCAATGLLEGEQRKQGKQTQKLREDLRDLDVALKAGIIDKKTFKKRSTEVRMALHDEALETRRTTSALKVMRGELRAAGRDAQISAREQVAASRAVERAARAQGKAVADAAERELRVRQKLVNVRSRVLAGTGSKIDAMRARADARISAAGAARKTTRRRELGTLGVAGGTILGSAVSGVASTAIDAVGDALVGSAAKAIRFESAMADVAKVVDGLKTPAGEVTAAYTKLTDELKTLSTRIAVAPEGLAEMAAAAGQAGIKGEELTRFVEDAAKTMVAFDITSEEAGNGLAKLRANLGLSQDEVTSLAGTMNVLSNSMASTAAEVLDATLRVGAVGKAANVSGQEVAGYTSAMIAAGATSEIAATATKNLILSMSAGAAATKRQREAFSRLGLNAEDVAKQFTGSAEQRLAISRKVIMGLGKLSNDARAATSMQLFGRESLGPIASLTTNLETFDRAMALASDNTAAATSVQKEFEVRSKTTANSLQLLQNRFSVVAIEIGEGMMPAINDVVREMGEFLGASNAAGKGIGEVLGDALRNAWHALRDLLGPADEFPGKVKAMIDTATRFASELGTVVVILGTAIDKLGGVGTAALALAAVGGPFALAAAAGVLAGQAIADSFTGAEHGMNEMLRKADEIRHKQHLAEMDAGQKEQAANNAEIERSTSAGDKRDRLKSRYANALRAGGEKDENTITRKVLSLSLATQGQNRFLGGGTEDDRLAEFEKHVSGVETRNNETATAGIRNRKKSRFQSLARRRKSLTPSEQKEYNALSKELDLRKPTGSGKGAKHKAETAYESDLEGEVTRLSKQSGERAGIKAAAEGKTRAEQFAAAKAAEESTTKALHERVDAGMSLPGNFMHDRLKSAQFQDVAGRGTPPPIAVSIVKVDAPRVEVEFSGPITQDSRELRDGLRRLFREELPEQLAAGIREARSPIVY